MSRPKGYIVSEETKRKISLTNKGHPVSDEMRVKMKLAKVGKISNAKGKYWSPEARERFKKIRIEQAAHLKGVPRPMSELQLRNIIQANKNRVITDEIREKMRLSHLGKPSGRKGKHLTDATKEKLRLARAKQISPMKGRHHSEETKNKLRLAALRQHENGNLSITSESCKLFLNALETKYGVGIKREFRRFNRLFDGSWKNYLFEIDSNYWHASLEANRIDSEKDNIAAQLGYKLVRLEVNSKQEINSRLIQYEPILRSVFNASAS